MALPLLQIVQNTLTHGTVCTEYLLNTGRRPQTSDRARKPPHNRLGERKERERERSGNKTVPQGGGCEGGKVPS